MSQPFNIIFCSNQEAAVVKPMEYLIEKGYVVFYANNENELIKQLSNNDIQLVIIELDFNSKDAISLTTEIRGNKIINQPFIFIFSDRIDDYVQITAFNAGADDFIVAPIKTILLEPRIAMLKKRLRNKIIHHERVKETKKFEIDKEEYVVIKNNQKIYLPRKEFEMISLMYFNSNKIITRLDFAKQIWDSADVAKSRTIDIHIRNIRRILGNDIIKTTKGVGYTINSELSN